MLGVALLGPPSAQSALSRSVASPLWSLPIGSALSPVGAVPVCHIPSLESPFWVRPEPSRRCPGLSHISRLAAHVSAVSGARPVLGVRQRAAAG